MEAKTEAPVKPEENVPFESEVVDARELTPEELAAINAVETGAEKNLSGAWKDTISTVFGGALGFVGAGYLNNYLMEQAPSGQAMTYSAVIFGAELVAGGFIAYWGSKKDRLLGEFMEGLGLGIIIAGLGTLLTQIAAGQGISMAFPAAEIGKQPLVPTRAIATPAMVYGEESRTV